MKLKTVALLTSIFCLSSLFCAEAYGQCDSLKEHEQQTLKSVGSHFLDQNKGFSWKCFVAAIYAFAKNNPTVVSDKNMKAFVDALYGTKDSSYSLSIALALRSFSHLLGCFNLTEDNLLDMLRKRLDVADSDLDQCTDELADSFNSSINESNA